jgi:eukaryotic-like serine/threonine-protein kinase
MDFFRFILSRKFLKHLGIAVLLIVVLTWITLMFLSFYTHHGDYISVPDLQGKNIENVSGNTEYGDYGFTVVDSVFVLDKEKGTILTQDPFPGARVKKGRTIYLTIVSYYPEKTNMPDLKFLTLRQAISILESNGLKVGRVTYIPTFDEDAVQQQKFEGKVIEPGIRLDKGSVIDLMVGMGAKASGTVHSGEDVKEADTVF